MSNNISLINLNSQFNPFYRLVEHQKKHNKNDLHQIIPSILSNDQTVFLSRRIYN